MSCVKIIILVEDNLIKLVLGYILSVLRSYLCYLFYSICSICSADTSVLVDPDGIAVLIEQFELVLFDRCSAINESFQDLVSADFNLI